MKCHHPPTCSLPPVLKKTVSVIRGDVRSQLLFSLDERLVSLNSEAKSRTQVSAVPGYWQHLSVSIIKVCEQRFISDLTTERSLTVKDPAKDIPVPMGPSGVNEAKVPCWSQQFKSATSDTIVFLFAHWFYIFLCFFMISFLFKCTIRGRTCKHRKPFAN